MEWSALNKEMRARGLVVAGGQDWLAGKILRIGHLGDVDVEHVVEAIGVIAEASAAVGLSVDGGAAVDEARRAGASGGAAEPLAWAEPVATGA